MVTFHHLQVMPSHQCCELSLSEWSLLMLATSKVVTVPVLTPPVVMQSAAGRNIAYVPVTCTICSASIAAGSMQTP